MNILMKIAMRALHVNLLALLVKVKLNAILARYQILKNIELISLVLKRRNVLNKLDFDIYLNKWLLLEFKKKKYILFIFNKN